MGSSAANCRAASRVRHQRLSSAPGLARIRQLGTRMSAGVGLGWGGGSGWTGQGAVEPSPGDAAQPTAGRGSRRNRHSAGCCVEPLGPPVKRICCGSPSGPAELVALVRGMALAPVPTLAQPPSGRAPRSAPPSRPAPAAAPGSATSTIGANQHRQRGPCPGARPASAAPHGRHGVGEGTITGPAAVWRPPVPPRTTSSRSAIRSSTLSRCPPLRVVRQPVGQALAAPVHRQHVEAAGDQVGGRLGVFLDELRPAVEQQGRAALRPLRPCGARRPPPREAQVHPVPRERASRCP